MGQMKDEIIALCKAIVICQEINRSANIMVKNNHTEYFTKGQLLTIASLTGNESMKLNREAKHKLSEWETELAECKRILNEKQNLYGRKCKTVEECKDYEETFKHHLETMDDIEQEEYDGYIKSKEQENESM